LYDYSKLRAKTIEVGKTSADVAALANMTPSTYSQKLTGKSQFTQDQIVAIIDGLGLTPQDIPAYFFAVAV
jgi:transcriptional regulator with XRE-family HTH domain